MIDHAELAAEHALPILPRRSLHRRTSCFASTQLAASESARVAALPSPVDPVVQTQALVCELVAGHAGGHIASTVAASGGEHWWWLRWAPEIRELFSTDSCDGTQADGPWSDWCLLPQGHPGPHSFDIGC